LFPSSETFSVSTSWFVFWLDSTCWEEE
jgi:hypothetical protein